MRGRRLPRWPDLLVPCSTHQEDNGSKIAACKEPPRTCERSIVAKVAETRSGQESVESPEEDERHNIRGGRGDPEETERDGSATPASRECEKEREIPERFQRDSIPSPVTSTSRQSAVGAVISSSSSTVSVCAAVVCLAVCLTLCLTLCIVRSVSGGSPLPCLPTQTLRCEPLCSILAVPRTMNPSTATGFLLASVFLRASYDRSRQALCSCPSLHSNQLLSPLTLRRAAPCSAVTSSRVRVFSVSRPTEALPPDVPPALLLTIQAPSWPSKTATVSDQTPSLFPQSASPISPSPIDASWPVAAPLTRPGAKHRSGEKRDRQMISSSVCWSRANRTNKRRRHVPRNS
jgi:hypothetical protein